MGSTTYSGSLTATGFRIVGGHKGKGPGPEIMAAGSLEGESVVNATGENLGKIKEIMLDLTGGSIAYAVLSTGGVMGVGDKLFAIPWSALTLDADHKCFVLDVSKQRLEHAEGFDKENWPSVADLSWATGDIH